jgi:hypothetical protein
LNIGTAKARWKILERTVGRDELPSGSQG